MLFASSNIIVIFDTVVPSAGTAPVPTIVVFTAAPGVKVTEAVIAGTVETKSPRLSVVLVQVKFAIPVTVDLTVKDTCPEALVELPATAAIVWIPPLLEEVIFTALHWNL